MPAQATAPAYSRSLFDARAIGEAFRRATRHIDGALFSARLGELAACGLPEARGSAHHSPGFIAVLTEVATAAPTKDADRSDARAFAKQFIERPAAYSQSRAGLAAVQFEARLIEAGGSLYTQFVETVLDGGESNFLAIFEGRLTEEDKRSLFSDFAHLVKITPIAEAGAVNYDSGELLEFSMFDCKVVGKPRDVLPHDAADPNALYPMFAVESIAPRTREEYVRTAGAGGIERSTCAFLFEEALAAAVAENGKLALRDPNGVVWLSETGDVWMPDLDSIVTAPRLYETTPEGSLRSFCRAWAIFSSPVLLEGVETPATVIVAGDHAWAVMLPLVEVSRVVSDLAVLYADLPAEGDMMIEAALRDLASELGTPCADEASIVESVQPTDARPTAADRDYEVRRASHGRLNEEVALNTDAGQMCAAFRAAFEKKAPGMFARCRLDARFGNEGQVFVKFANVPDGSSELDILNAKNSFLLSIGPFDKDGRALGKLKVETLTSWPRKEMGLRGKTAAPEAITSYVEKFISGMPLTEADEEEPEKPGDKEGKPNPS